MTDNKNPRQAGGLTEGNINNLACNSNAPADNLLSRLDKVKATGPGKWIACCPAHDDRNPSLGVTEKGDGALLLKCWAGCETSDVVAAVGLTMADLFPRRPDSPYPPGQRLSAEERAERQRLADERAASERESIDRERQETAKHAAAILKAAVPAQANHPYLQRKGVSPVSTLWEIGHEQAYGILGYRPKAGVEYLTGRLLVAPIYQGGALSSVELIDGDKRKAALSGRGTKVGGYWTTEERLPDGDGQGMTLLIGEGVATVLSASESSGHQAIAALSSNNLAKVAQAMRSRYQAAELVILADLVKADGKPDPHAIEAARAVGGKLAVPEFGAGREPGMSDFNDLAVTIGKEAVTRAIGEATLVHGGDAHTAGHEAPELGRTEAEIIADAMALNEESDSETISAIVSEAAALPPVAKRRVHNAIKKATGIPLSTIREQERDDRAETKEPDHLALARSVVESEGAENIIGQQAHVWRYQRAGVWRPLESRAEKQIVQSHLDEEHGGESISRALVESVTDLFRTEVYRPSHEWNTGPADAVCTLNGEVQLHCGQWKLMEHRRDYYRTVQIPVLFDPDASAPRFGRFLDEVFHGDPDAHDKKVAVLEMMGYSLMAHTRFERFAILVGSGANGKSVLLSVLEALLGRDNVAGVQPSQFDRSFQRAHLHLKLANIVTEIREGEVIADAQLKAIVSGEPTTVERKFCDPFVMRPYATCWFGTNHMPHTRDFSDALFRRALVVPFNRKFAPGKGADPKLKDKLLDELPGVLNLALDAYGVALHRGYFTQPESCLEAKREWRLNADQAAQFINEQCSIGVGEVSSSELYEAYRRWAEREGVHNTLKHKSFSDRVANLGYKKERKSAGVRFYGLRLQDPAASYRAASDGQ